MPCCSRRSAGQDHRFAEPPGFRCRYTPCMTKTAGDSDLVGAAQTLEDELQKLEELSRSVLKIRLHTEKSISRAARELNEALLQPEKLADGLRLLAGAMARMQERQQAALDPLAERAVEIRNRAEKLGEYMQRLAALGAEAGEAAKVLQAVSDDADRSTVLGEVEASLTAITDNARTLAEAARSDDLPDVAREVDTFKQSIGSLRGRLVPKS